MKLFTICIVIIFNINSALADKYKFVSAEDRIKNADFIGLFTIVSGESTKTLPKDYEYVVLINDVIKGEHNFKDQQINLTVNCGLSLAYEYLVYAYFDDVTGVLGANCPVGLVLETYRALPDLKIQVIVPNYHIEKIPVLKGDSKDICQLMIEGKCESVYQGKSLDYQDIKNLIQAYL